MITNKTYNTLFQKLKRAKRREKRIKLKVWELFEIEKKRQRTTKELHGLLRHTTSINKLKKNHENTN